jgi:hypothetical protein
MLAETNGMLSAKEDFEPLLNFAIGAYRSTFAGTFSALVSPGIIRNSEKVLETSLRIFATVTSLFA